MSDRQATLGEVSGISKHKGLSENQRKIAALLNEGLCQATVAQRLGFSRAYICQTVKKLESHNLIKATDHYPNQVGKRTYTKFYEASPELLSRVKGERVTEPLTSCRVHNLRIKVAIISQSDKISTDPRTAFQKSWFMRGKSERYKFWFVGKAGMPSVTLDVHPKTIVAYVDRKQFIPAKTPEEAKEIGFRSIYAAIDTFVEQQAKFNVRIETAHTGQTIGKPHGGFVGTDSPVMKEGVTRKDWWIDKSIESEVGPGKVELETDDPTNMTRLDRLIKVSEEVDIPKLPEMFQGMIDPLNEKMVTLVSQLQGGRPIEQMFQNTLDMMLRMMEKMDRMDEELKELRKVRG